MTNPSQQNSLSENDYLEILSIIRMLGDCENRSSLFGAIKNLIFPFLRVQSCMMRYMDPDLPHARFMDVIFDEKIRKEPLSLENKKALQSWTVFGDHFRSKLVDKERTVLATNIDFPNEMIAKTRKKFLEGPESKHYPKEFQSKSGLIAVDKPDNYIVLSFHRYDENLITFREVRILELLSPHIIQAIKGIITREELLKYKNIADALSNSSTAIALIDTRPWVLFCNTSFQSIVEAKEGELLPNELAAFLREEISKTAPQSSQLDSSLKLSFFKIKNQVYRLCLIPLASEENQPDRRWLLKIKPPSEHAAQINLKMIQAGLTSREVEVACLMLDDMKDQQISDRLFISIHTVRTHIKSIYKKLTVTSRLELSRVLKK
jgi:DNA-binding CsgD family transcriptional regulator